MFIYPCIKISLVVEQVVVLDVPDGCDAGELSLPMVCTGNSLYMYPRILIRLGKDAKASVSMPQVQESEQSSCLVNSFFNIYLEKGASLTLDRMDTALSASLIETVMVSQKEGSCFNFHSFWM